MAWLSSSFSRTLLNSARSASLRSPTKIRPPPRLRFANSRTLEELGCISSMLPLQRLVSNARLTSYIAVDVLAFCELSQCRTCPDR